jgi:hypothetical protein
VRVAFRPAIEPPHVLTAEAVADLVDGRMWPEVQEAYGGLRALPGVVLSALLAAGLGGGILARRRARARPRLLGVVAPLKLRRRKILGRLRRR